MTFPTIKKISDTCFLLKNEDVSYYYFSAACAALHRVDGPAIEYKNGERHWYLLGELHRNDGPAIEKDKMKQWWLNGKQYTEDEFKKAITSKNKKK